jgi:hypothetical protein
MNSFHRRAVRCFAFSRWLADFLPQIPRDGTTRTAAAHRDAALPWVSGEHDEGGHWLGTFAVYLLASEEFH